MGDYVACVTYGRGRTSVEPDVRCRQVKIFVNTSRPAINLLYFQCLVLVHDSMCIYMGILRVCDFGKIGLKIGGGGCLGGYL